MTSRPTVSCRGLTKIHCIAASDLDTNEQVFLRHPNDNIKEGLAFLKNADELWGHNIMGYDIQAIREVYPKWTLQGASFDTLILSRLFFTDLLDRDFRSRPANMPGNLYGRHSLEAWGHRLNVHKSEFGKVLKGIGQLIPLRWVCTASKTSLFLALLLRCLSPSLRSTRIALTPSTVLPRSWLGKRRCGFPFDVDKAHQLESKLRTELDAFSDEMRETFLFVDGGLFTPKRNNSTQGYVEGAAMCKLKQFSPYQSRPHRMGFRNLQNWTAKERTASGRAKIDDSVLQEIGTDEALKFARILELQKHLGQLSDGKNAWLKQERNGRIHHGCVLATNTGRMAHLRPNLAQVPSAHEYRELFYPGKDRVQVGADASGWSFGALVIICLDLTVASLRLQLWMETFTRNWRTFMERTEGREGGHLLPDLWRWRYEARPHGWCFQKSKATAKGKEIRARIMEGLDGFKELSAAIQSRAEGDVLRV